MGYDVWASGKAIIPAAKVQQAKDILEETYAEFDAENEANREVYRKFSFSQMIFHSPLVADTELVHVDESEGVVVLTLPEDSFRRPDEVEQLFDALAPTINPDCVFEFSGEDGTQWRWTFKAGAFYEDHAEVVYGDGKAEKAVECLRAIVGLLYPDNKVKNDWSPETVGQIADLLRDHSFGPLAGLDLLQVIAEESGAA